MDRKETICLGLSAATVELSMVIIHRPAQRVPAGGAAVGVGGIRSFALSLAGAAGFGEGTESVERLLRANGWLAGRLGLGQGWGQNSTREEVRQS